MDEFNSNTSQNSNEQEPTTPYQTPVRGSSPGGSQHQDSTQRMNGGASGDGNPYQQNPYSQNTNGSQNPNGGNPYGQWGPPGGQNQKKPKKPKKDMPGLKILALGVVVALVAFVGGVAVSGGLKPDSSLAGTIDSGSAAEETETYTDTSLLKVTPFERALTLVSDTPVRLIYRRDAQAVIRKLCDRVTALEAAVTSA